MVPQKNNNISKKKKQKTPALKVDMVPLPNSRVLQRLSEAHFNYWRIWEDCNNNNDDYDDDDHSDWRWMMVMNENSGDSDYY